ncbi:hypothetical protein HMPREF1981_00839 [Bacteroides pyogenes F0041]|uniref:Uncharacterized protein n=1 Tax=Bacteroides pyogenes F0041 TaxID=1321819 RepID=U2CRB3_9BACE|nr:hypothetical protein HMPREF1981_00839 [Bacteroides pyogenes F0041]
MALVPILLIAYSLFIMFSSLIHLVLAEALSIRITLFKKAFAFQKVFALQQ